MTKKIREEVHNKYNHHCAYCGCFLEYKDMQVDHIDAVYRARLRGEKSKNSIDNYNPSCRMCNFYKSTFTIEEFRNELTKIVKRLHKIFIFRLAKKYHLIEVKDIPIVFYFEEIENKKRKEQQNKLIEKISNKI